MKNFLSSVIVLIIIICIVAFIWFFLLYFMITVGIIGILFVIGVIPVKITYKDGTEKSYKIIDLIKFIKNNSY